jgi:hypothetical protein
MRVMIRRPETESDIGVLWIHGGGLTAALMTDSSLTLCFQNISNFLQVM